MIRYKDTSRNVNEKDRGETDRVRGEVNESINFCKKI